MSRLLVTGGAGFIGANFVEQTVREFPQYEVSVIDALTYAGDDRNLDAVKDDIEFVEGTIVDADLVDGLVSESDAVVHFAAESHVDKSLRDPWPFVESNLIGTYNILESVRKHAKRLHHISTDEVFGGLPVEGSERFTTETPYNPSNPYSATKAGSDMLVRAWVRSYDVQATISNCANNYGPYQHIEKFMARQITSALTGRQPKVFGDGSHMREWTHVRDHNSAVHLILQEGRIGETYLIGSGEEITNKEVVRIILGLAGRDPDDFAYVAERPGHDARYSIDPSKLQDELGWRPDFTSLEDGILATIEWYAAHRDWWEADKEAVEAFYAESGQ